MNPLIPFSAPEEIHQAISRLGRTEDIKFSPNNRKLAIAGFTNNRILILDIDLARLQSDAIVRLTNHIELSSPHLKYPHGLCFLNDDTLAVANRKGEITLFRLPSHSTDEKTYCPLHPSAVIGQKWTHSPGSITSHETAPGIFTLLVCNNYAQRITGHTLHIGPDNILSLSNKILLSNGLRVPDGIALSHDRRWIAISNHDTHSVNIFSYGPDMTQETQAVGIMRGIEYPHGLCFTPDDKHLLVADAGRPCIRIYTRGNASWAGEFEPHASPQIISGETFKRGNYNPQEGGPKGIDIDVKMRLLVSTSEHQALAFFDLPILLRQTQSGTHRIPPAPPVQPPNARRTQACPCGSGKRFKHCCGQRETIMTPLPGRLSLLKAAALAAHQASDLNRAEEYYRQALTLAHDEPDCLHMLSVVLYSQGRCTEAAPLIRKAGALSQWRLPGITHNFGLIVGARLIDREPARLSALRLAYAAWRKQRNSPTEIQRTPLVSIVIPSYNHAAYIEQALDSVFSQTYQNLELVIIDDGSSDGSPDIIARKLSGCPWPHRFITRENRGAHSTLNEAISLAGGEYINPLNSDDQFTTTRIASLVEQIANRGQGWGFALCEYLDERGNPLTPMTAPTPPDWVLIQGTIDASDTVGSAFLSTSNPSISSGNLFFSKNLFNAISGFQGLDSNHDWDFCLRLLWLSEPIFVAQTLYRYRLHDRNTIHESAKRNRLEAYRLHSNYHERALRDAPVNRFAPARETMGLHYIAKSLEIGQGTALSPERLIALDDEANRLDAAVIHCEPPTGHGLSIVGFFRGDLGLAESARTLAITCQTGSINATYRDAEVNLGISQSNLTIEHMLTADTLHRHVLFYINPDQLAPIWHRYADRGGLNNRYVIGYWYWEIDAFPENWRYALDLVDEIWVATDFVREVMQRATEKPVRKIPHAIDVSLLRPYYRAEFDLPEERFLFLFSFDFKSFSERKNPWAVIEAFQHAFEQHPSPVGLVVKCFQGNHFPEKLATLLELAAADPRIIIIDKLLTREEVTGLQSVCDAYVSLHRSEGLGLGMAECMALGKPVIATAYSGNLEFMTPENSYLVDYSMIPVKPGEYIDYEPSWLWADADISHAAAQMRHVVEDEAYRLRISQSARLHMATHFNHQVAAQAIKQRLAELAS